MPSPDVPATTDQCDASGFDGFPSSESASLEEGGGDVGRGELDMEWAPF